MECNIMKRTSGVFGVAVMLVLALCVASCAKEIAYDSDGDDDGASGSGTKAKNTLTVTTRATTDDGSEVSYPVNVYVFNANNKCVGVSTIADATGQMSLTLAAGKYTVCAIGGTDDGKYTLPSKSDATPTAVVAIKDGEAHGDLMTATATPVTVAAGQTNSVEITLNRKVMLIDNISITNMPSTVTAVTVTLPEVHKNIRIDGTYDGADVPTVDLKQGADGTWSMEGSLFILPIISDGTVTVTYTNGDITKQFSFTSDQFEENHKISITGDYESDNIELTGTISGAKWGEDRTVSFSFNSDKSVVYDLGPAVGSFYNDSTCFVVSKTVENNACTVLLMTTKEKDNLGVNVNSGSTQTEVKKATDNAIKSLAVDGIDGWRLPTLAELRAAYNLKDKYSNNRGTQKSFPSVYGYCILQDNGIITAATERSDSVNITKVQTCLRAFTTLTLK